MTSVIENAKKNWSKSAVGAFMMQSPDVIAHSLLLLQVFEGKRTSIKMRNLKDKCPKVVGIIKAYLCGDGFHISPPPITAGLTVRNADSTSHYPRSSPQIRSMTASLISSVTFSAQIVSKA
jgi:hypothetical protein